MNFIYPSLPIQLLAGARNFKHFLDKFLQRLSTATTNLFTVGLVPGPAVVNLNVFTTPPCVAVSKYRMPEVFGLIADLLAFKNECIVKA